MSGVVEALYQRSPVWAQQAMVAAYGWWWHKRRFGPQFHSLLDEIRARESWSSSEWHRYQEAALSKILRSAACAPYYRETFRAAGVSLETATPFEALARLPLLDKQTLRVRGRDLLTTSPPRGTEVFRSSGTTGTPTEIFFTEPFHQLVQAFFEVRNRNWAGVTYSDRRVMFGVRKVCRFDQAAPPFWRYSPAENLAYASIYHLSPRFLPHYVEFLQEFAPTVIMGYPNSLASVARFVLERGLRIPPAKAILTTSETVTDSIRAALEAAWQCRVVDTYGAVEACVLGGQCAYGRYHISPDYGVLEILDGEGRPCPPGVIGTAVCTGLHNHLQPLLRYAIGDAIAWSEEATCACGREMPLVRAIEGRLEDLCTTPDGRQILRFDTVFKGVETIQEAQVVQESLDHFVIRVVPTTGFSTRDREVLLSNMRLHVGGVRVEVVEVASIERHPSGKFRPVVCKVRP